MGGKHAKAIRFVTVRSKEADAYIEEVRWIAKANGIREAVSGKLLVDCMLYPHRPKDWATRARKNPENWEESVECIDIKNGSKVLMDALGTVVFSDDKWIWRETWERAIPDERGARVEVWIRPFIRQTMTMALPLEIEA
jgi:crossover junction endodeoxyribonuclease RusA